jgi:tripartite-type tricarboxylate transporter receptor subunit TctC
LTVHPSVPAKSVAELVQHLKANPGKLTYSSSGIGSPIHMAGELFQVASGTRMIHIPYKGMGAAYTDMVAGRIQVGFPTIISSVPHLQAGKLRALAVTPAKRVSAAPDIPTFAEAGLKGVVVVNWYGLIAPLRTPKPIVERIAKEVATAMRSPDMEKRLAAEGSEAVGSSPTEFAAHIRSEIDQWSRVIKQAGIKGE